MKLALKTSAIQLPRLAPTVQRKCKIKYLQSSFFARKTQKIVVDHVKVVIKAGKKYPADQKVRALKLLNKAITKSETNPEFLKYVQKKIMERLAILV